MAAQTLLLSKDEDGRTEICPGAGDLLPYIGFEARSRMLNPATGADMTYQQNKVHNLKLAARMLNGVVIRPGKPSPSGSWYGMLTGRSHTGTR